jgi:hypothetical protein
VLTQRSHCVTFGGNPVYTAGGHAVPKVLDKEERQEYCVVVGAHLINRLKELQDKYEIIGDVRGRGLMVGVELVTDRTSKTPARGETSLAFERMKVWECWLEKGECMEMFSESSLQCASRRKILSFLWMLWTIHCQNFNLLSTVWDRFVLCFSESCLHPEDSFPCSGLITVSRDRWS